MKKRVESFKNKTFLVDNLQRYVCTHEGVLMYVERKCIWEYRNPKELVCMKILMKVWVRKNP